MASSAPCRLRLALGKSSTCSLVFSASMACRSAYRYCASSCESISTSMSFPVRTCWPSFSTMHPNTIARTEAFSPVSSRCCSPPFLSSETVASSSGCIAIKSFNSYRCITHACTYAHKIRCKITTNFSNLQDLAVKNQKCLHNVCFYGSRLEFAPKCDRKFGGTLL